MMSRKREHEKSEVRTMRTALDASRDPLRQGWVGMNKTAQSDQMATVKVCILFGSRNQHAQ